MEKDNNKKSLIISLILIIIILISIIILFATGVINLKSTDNKKEVVYDVYQKGNEIKLLDGTKWIVLSDSDKDKDYVTVIANKDYTDEFEYKDSDTVIEEIYNNKTIDYKNSNIRKELEDFYLPRIKIRLKEVDGYKIRLITLDEIFNLYDGWKYDNEYDSYDYTGTEKIIDSVSYSTTMTTSKCNHIVDEKSTKCGNLYLVGSICDSYDDNDNCTKENYIISSWDPGLIRSLVPVINVYKTEIIN